MQKGIPTLVEFFGARDRREPARRVEPADLLIGNNVLAHVPGPQRLRRRDEARCSSRAA